MAAFLRTRLALLVFLGALFGSALATRSSNDLDPFRQIDSRLPSPNDQRTAAGGPGHEYWQQRADYSIAIELDDENQHIVGSETITYHNNSPDSLRYLWLQLDANLFTPRSHSLQTSVAPNLDSEMSYDYLRALLAKREFEGGFQIERVVDEGGAPLHWAVSDTMMRVDLPQPLAAGESMSFGIDWNHAINDAKLMGFRTGFEYFEADDNYIYEIAQFYPRMAAYTDYAGWQNKQYLGRGEFTLEFGDYEVSITVPTDHVLAATGVLQNPDQVLKPVWRERLAAAEVADKPQFVITPDEAEANESSTPDGKQTWVFAAENVRDFAFASSRKFIWDAWGRPQEDGRTVMAMSYYPNEGEPLWSQYSTQSVAHTLDVYGRVSFPYPYPVAISVNGKIGGMEYPMICFNGPRPESDGTYREATKYGLITVIIHEVGHNWFPMIVNSDERQWTWMDEGLNSFVQYLAEQEWEAEYPSRWGSPQKIVGYMKSAKQRPIMTGSDSLHQFGNNAYAKPATALNILRETVLGRDLFDFAFREYSLRWKFKRPTPSDLFRTLEDASAVDLDWFWNGWFYTTNHTDIAIDGLRHYTIDSRNPDIAKAEKRELRDAQPKNISATRNAELALRIEAYPELLDFYNSYDELDVTADDEEAFVKLLDKLDGRDAKLLDSPLNFYVVDFSNIGGLVMPILLELHYTDGTTSELRIPAEIWRRSTDSVSKLIISEREIESLVLDPHLETADGNLDNNYFPRQIKHGKLRLKGNSKRGNPMRDAQKMRGRDDSDSKPTSAESSAPSKGASD